MASLRGVLLTPIQVMYALGKIHSMSKTKSEVFILRVLAKTIPLINQINANINQIRTEIVRRTSRGSHANGLQESGREVRWHCQCWKV